MSTTTSGTDKFSDLAALDPEQLPVPPHERKGAGHFLGLYAGEHVAATEFVIGATFVALGASFKNILIGLIIGNLLATLTFWLVTAPVATQARLSLYTYLQKITGDLFSKLYNLANAIIFAVISAAMITVSATAIRRIVNVPAQTQAYPTSVTFVIICVVFSLIAVIVAVYGFDILARFAGVAGPWLMVMFTAGGLILLPALTESTTGMTQLHSFSEFLDIGTVSAFTGVNANGEPGIGLIEVIGFAWAANTFSHMGLIDMAMLRYARKSSAGLATATGMLFGHYVAWISAGIMGAATATVLVTSIAVVDPGDVAWYALGGAGFLCVVIAGWTTANPNLYRAGLAAQAVFPQLSRAKATFLVGIVVIVTSCFPFVFRNILPLLTYAGIILVPIGGIVFAEHHIFKRLGYTKFWMSFSGAKQNVPALITWAICLIFSFTLVFLDAMPFVYVFLPTWALAVTAYTILAGRGGAKDSYPEAQAKEDAYQQRIEEYHQYLSDTQDVSAFKDTTVPTRVLKWIAIALLLLMMFLAIQTAFLSPDLYTYLVHREQFYTIALWSSFLYFAIEIFLQIRSSRIIKSLAAIDGEPS